MKIIIQNCFQWVNFHVMNKLLQDAHQVYGIDSIEKQEHEFLYYFVGRNANFTLLESKKGLKEKEVGFWLSTISNEEALMQDLPNNEKADQYVIVEKSNVDELEWVDNKNSSNSYVIQVPNLVGPWMNQKDYYERIHSFENVIYIEDFVEWFFRFVNTSDKKNTTRLRTKSQDENEEKIMLPSRKTREEVDVIMHKHFNRFPGYYGK